MLYDLRYDQWYLIKIVYPERRVTDVRRSGVNNRKFICAVM